MNHWSVIQWLGPGGTYPCGYCKTVKREDSTNGMWAHILDPAEYQHLINRNWRRSGKYCYRPLNERICCPMYTIRCDANDYRLTKSHKNVIRAFNNFIMYDIKPSKARLAATGVDISSESSSTSATQAVSPSVTNQATSDDSNNSEELPLDHIKRMGVMPNNWKDVLKVSSFKKTFRASNITVESNQAIQITPAETFSLQQSTRKENPNKSKYKRQQKLRKKVMLRERCDEEQAKRILYERSRLKQKCKSLEDRLSEYLECEKPKHTFKKVLVPTAMSSIFGETASRATHQLYTRYQQTIHKDDRTDFSSFKHFLLDTPLEYDVNALFDRNDIEDQELAPLYGSFHEQYFIDDRLVAVAVLDILPNCISSVYLMYAPEYSFLHFGIYSALNEIALTRKYSTHIPDLKYYYMGYYIHNCSKMRYKKQFQPSDLLCCETYQWFPLQSCIAKLSDDRLYARFCDDPSVVSEDDSVTDDDIQVFAKRTVMNWAQYKRRYPQYSREEENRVKKYAALVGKRCVREIAYYIDNK